jgi:hypothetical protein
MSKGRGKIEKADGEKTMFSSTYQPLKNGRKPKVFSQIAKEFKDKGIEKATPEAVREAYEYLLALPLSDILEISGNPKIENDMPSLMRLAAKEMTGKRGIEILKEMLDRAHGRAKQSVDHTTKGEGLNFSFNALSVQEKEAMLALIEKSKNGA